MISSQYYYVSDRLVLVEGLTKWGVPTLCACKVSSFNGSSDSNTYKSDILTVSYQTTTKTRKRSQMWKELNDMRHNTKPEDGKHKMPPAILKIIVQSFLRPKIHVLRGSFNRSSDHLCVVNVVSFVDTPLELLQENGSTQQSALVTTY